MSGSRYLAKQNKSRVSVLRIVWSEVRSYSKTDLVFNSSQKRPFLRQKQISKLSLKKSWLFQPESRIA
jgi:uncharacterized phage-associated protein